MSKSTKTIKVIVEILYDDENTEEMEFLMDEIEINLNRDIKRNEYDGSLTHEDACLEIKGKIKK